MRRTVWLASYPKSGNTWFRLFLAALLYPQRRPLDPNDLPLSTPIASDRRHFDRALEVSSALLTPDEVARLRPDADRVIRRDWATPLLLRKVHDAFTWLPDGRPLLGRGPDHAAIYLLRDPWDVAVSGAHHAGLDDDAVAARMTESHHVMADGANRQADQLPQRLLSWGGHALSWLAAPMPIHLLRYEAMRRDPLPAFRGAVRFLGLDHDDREIAEALDASRLERLQAWERGRRFQETPTTVERFFRKGAVGEGMHRLSPQRIAQLTAMRRRVEQAVRERFG